jgi:hypothetical protein
MSSSFFCSFPSRHVPYLLTYLFTCLLTYLLACLLTYLLAHLLTCSLTYLLTYLLTYSWSRVLLEKLTDFAASQEIHRIYGIRKFITVLTSARHLSLS